MMTALLFNNTVINAVTMDANIIGTVQDIAEANCFAVHAIWTGTPAGNIITEGSNDNTNFYTLDTHAAGGTAANYIFNVSNPAYRYVRVKYTFTSSTGSLTVYVSAKNA